MTGPMRHRAPEPREPTLHTPRADAVRDAENGSLGEAVASAGAVVLGILGIIGLLPGVLDSIAAIAAGFAIVVGSMALGARITQLVGQRTTPRGAAGGPGMAALAGLAGIGLGVLALLGVSRVGLLSIAPIVFGFGLMLSSAATARFERMLQLEANQGAVYLASGVEVLVGAGAVVLGILALQGVAPLTLSLIAMLSVGAAELMSGTSVASQMMVMR
jgi:hypothetical protein